MAFTPTGMRTASARIMDTAVAAEIMGMVVGTAASAVVVTGMVVMAVRNE